MRGLFAREEELTLYGERSGPSIMERIQDLFQGGFGVSTAIAGILAVSGIALLGCLTAYAREGLYEAAASKAYESRRMEAVDSVSHQVNFTVVRAAGAACTSWIYLPDTGIDYPLVQGPDNETYLQMDAYGNESKAGAIFVNFANSPLMTDAKTVIFGHDMRDKSMFTPLHKYADREWGEAHPDAYIYMDDGSIKHYALRYYMHVTPTEESVYITSKAEVPEQAAMLLRARAKEVYAEHTGGNLICLSVCKNHTMRDVVVFEHVDGEAPVVASTGQEEAVPEHAAENAPAEDTVDLEHSGVLAQ